MESEEKFLQGLLDDIESGKLVLPTLPEVALRVRDTVENGNATATQIANAVTLYSFKVIFWDSVGLSTFMARRAL